MKALERLGFTGFETDKSFLPFVFGGDDGIRTHDPLVANEVLSQLSHAPTCTTTSYIFLPNYKMYSGQSKGL